MREYKFRQWTTGWSSGKDRMVYLGDISDEEFSPLTQGILMQYTGLKDINGTEIYEGDVVKVSLPKVELDGYMEMEINIGFVTFNPHEGYGVLYKNGKRDFLIYNHAEVLGNKYENPSLLDEINYDKE